MHQCMSHATWQNSSRWVRPSSTINGIIDQIQALFDVKPGDDYRSDQSDGNFKEILSLKLTMELTGTRTFQCHGQLSIHLRRITIPILHFHWNRSEFVEGQSPKTVQTQVNLGISHTHLISEALESTNLILSFAGIKLTSEYSHGLSIALKTIQVSNKSRVMVLYNQPSRR